MNLRDLIDLLAEQPKAVYRDILISALIGPLILRLLGLKGFSRWVRPLAMLVLIGGMYAKQQQQRTTTGR